MLKTPLRLLTFVAIGICLHFTPAANAQSFRAPLTGQINDDFGPRLMSGVFDRDKFIHKGIDYDGEFGDVITAIESGTITDGVNLDDNGYYIRVRGDVTRKGFTYLHLFSDVANPNRGPAILTTQSLNSSQEASFITLERIGIPGAGGCYAVVFWQDASTIVKGLCQVPGLNLSRPNVQCGSACQTRNRVIAGEELAAVGKSGGVDKHLHLQVEGGTLNPLYYLEHEASGATISLQPVNSVGRLLQGSDFSPTPLVAYVDSRQGLDLNKVELFAYRAGASTIGGPIAEFCYRGSPSEGAGTLATDGGFSANVRYSGSENNLGVDPFALGQDRFITPWDWASLSPGTYVIEARAYGINGALTTTTSTVQIASSAPPPPTAPTARNDSSYSMIQGATLAVPAPGVLANDTYPTGSVIEFLPPFPPAGLTNVAPYDGGFILDLRQNSTFTGILTLRYLIHSTSGDSNVASVTVQVNPTPPTLLRITGVNDQVGPPAGMLPNAVSVLATDQFGNPVGQVPVTFRVTFGGGCLSMNPTGTNCQSEVAMVTNGTSGPMPGGNAGVFWRLGGFVGTQTVEVVSPGLTTIVFRATALVPGFPTIVMYEGPGVWGWNEVDNATGRVIGGVVCTPEVCGRNGEWRTWPPDRLLDGRFYPNGYPENSTYIWSPINAAAWGQYYPNGLYITSYGQQFPPGTTQPQ